jgi:ubiquinone/menaquinone biosynthesis C-methylase UbiE
MEFAEKKDLIGYLRDKLIDESSLYTRHVDIDRVDTLAIRWGNDDVYSEKHRFDLIKFINGGQCDKLKILDMAAGCGSFLIQGLKQGYDIEGVEPEEWKLSLIKGKCSVNSYDRTWINRIKKGVGEQLPYKDDHFDVFDSWQTFEHVQDPKKCLEELYRVLKFDGCGIVRAPSYMSFYEGHYQIFWFPMMSEILAKWYLRLRRRPLGGLNTFTPINTRTIEKLAEGAGFEVVNIKRKQIYDAAKRKLNFLHGSIGIFGLPFIYLVWDILQGVKNFGRVEATINLLLIKGKNK